MEPQLLVFDLDGTLIDSRADLAAGVNHMRAHYGLDPLSLETVSGYVGDGVGKLVERSLQGAEVDFDEALRINIDYYQSHSTVRTTLYDGVRDGIPKLVDAGHRLAVLTNKPGDPSRAILEHFGIAGYFDAIIGGGDLAVLKPDPAGVRTCLEIAGMDSADAWMIGDHCTDLSVAQNAGIQSAFARYGFGDARGLEPDAYFASFPELVGYFVGR